MTRGRPAALTHDEATAEVAKHRARLRELEIGLEQADLTASERVAHETEIVRLQERVRYVVMVYL